MNPSEISTTSPEFDFLDMPDDQVMSMSAPPAAAAPVEAEVVPPVAVTGEEATTPPSGEASTAQANSEEGDADGSTPPAPAGEANADGASPDDALASADDADLTPPPVTPAKPAPKADDTKPAPKVDGEVEPKVEPPKDDAKPAEPKVPTADDHKSFYEDILGKPIKANGKEIQLQSPDEAKKLIQMGLNYTKKMQAMQPVLRVVKMLENNGLMDESKLSHLIDVSKGDSGAIQKLLADQKFDPMSADAEQAAKYVPADHRVSDLEMSFNTVLDEVQQTPTGVELISEVHGQWDADSKRALFQKPEILTKLAEHRAEGLYAQISSEVDRLRTLGQITPDIPFLQAYHAVGEMLHKQGRLVGKQEEAPAPVAVDVPAVPVETRVAAPTPKVSNTTQAQATAPVRTAPSNPTPPSVDYLSMDDAAFAKEMGPRL